MYQVRWITCGNDGRWCALETIDLSKVTAQGVYVIWHEGNPGRIVKVGQGEIADRLCKHRADLEILQYGGIGRLRVTWATVPISHRNGVERFLADRYQPLVGDAYPDVVPIEVNLPGAA